MGAFDVTAFQNDAFQVGVAVVVAIGGRVVANTVQSLGNLFKKTILYSSPNFITQPSLAVRKFLDQLKADRKKELTQERQKLASLKTEKKQIEVKLIEGPKAPQGKQVEIQRISLRQRIGELDGLIAQQAETVKEYRRQAEEIARVTEQARIDAIAEQARQEWMAERALDAERFQVEEQARIAQEEDEMMQVLLLIHEDT
jgi:hypothetical protein